MFPSKTTLIALVLVLGSTSSGFAGADMADYSIRRALGAPEAREKLDPHIRLSFGHRARGVSARHIGRWKSSKSSGFAEGPEAACQRSFLAAVVSLQRRARGEGGNAVININSYYDDRETSSGATYVCQVGERRSAVTLMGTVVTVSDRISK